VDENQIRMVVREVIQEVLGAASAAPAGTQSSSTGQAGVFGKIEDAIAAAKAAQAQLESMTLEQRGKIIQALRDTTLQYADDFSRRTVQETGMGRFEHKVLKHHGVSRFTPGIEMLTTQAWSGDHGLTIEEMAPFGVIGAVTPSTHPVPTLVCNSINFIAGGNVGVFNPHPSAKNVSAYAVDILNRAMMAAGAPANCIATVAEPTIESAQALFRHPDVAVLLITGGPGVVAEAMKAPKRAICAGPGNPPVVVDETADIRRAARAITDGASFDNNILCIGEKQVFCVESVFDRLKAEMLAYNCVELNAAQIDALAGKAFGVKNTRSCTGARLNRELVGRNASVLAQSIGLSVPDSTMLLIGETDFEHVFVQEEQMMPFVPLVRCRDVAEAIDMAVKSEHGHRHTSLIHSLNVATMSEMARRAKTTIFVKNGPSYAGLGNGGEGYPSYSIATPTGEGITTPCTFTRKRRCALVDYFRII
jgi:aldehyde dehydrogenase